MAREKHLDDDDFQPGSAPTTVRYPAIRDIADVEDDTDDVGRLLALLGESTDILKINLYRAMPNRKEAYLCQLDPADFSLDSVKAKYGGGEFIVKVYDERSKVRHNKRVVIEGEPLSTAPTVPAATQALGGVESLIAAMREENRLMMQNMMTMMQPAPQPSRREMLEEMAIMSKLFQPTVAPQGDPVAMLLKGMELGKELAPKAAGEASGMDVMMEAVKSFGPALGDITKQLNAPPQPQRPQVAPHQPQQLPQEDDGMFKMYLKMIVSSAKSGKDPALYADLIADQMSDEQLTELLSTPDLIAKLAEINSEVMDHRQWFETLISELRAIMSLTNSESGDNVTTPNISGIDNAPHNNAGTLATNPNNNTVNGDQRGSAGN